MTQRLFGDRLGRSLERYRIWVLDVDGVRYLICRPIRSECDARRPPRGHRLDPDRLVTAHSLRVDAAARSQRSGTGSACGEDLAQPRREGVRLTGLAVFAAEESAVIAREIDGLRAEAFGGGNGAAVGHLAI